MSEHGLLTHLKEKLEKLKKKQEQTEWEIQWTKDVLDERKRNREGKLGRNVSSIEFSTRVAMVFRKIGIETVGDIVDKGVEELKTYKNLGTKSIVEIAWKLDKLGISELLSEIEDNKWYNDENRMLKRWKNRLILERR